MGRPSSLPFSIFPSSLIVSLISVVAFVQLENVRRMKYYLASSIVFSSLIRRHVVYLHRRTTNNNSDRDDRFLEYLPSSVQYRCGYKLSKSQPTGSSCIFMCFGEWKRFTHVQRRDSSGKLVPTLLHCISVTNLIKINEQNKSIGIGPLYLQTEFEAI